MGQDVRNDSRFCQIPQGPQKDLGWYLKPNPVLIAVSLTLILMTSGLAYNLMLPPPYTPPPPPPPPPAVIAIDGDANFSDTALLKGWPGDGSPEDPFLIDGLDIEINGSLGISGESHCIFIGNTRVSFIIRNCNLTGASSHLMSTLFAGITLVNVSGGLLVNNILRDNEVGILLADSLSNTVVNNTCNNNSAGITLGNSHYNTVVNNTCNSNNWFGIWLMHSDSNTLANNICNNNDIGIHFGGDYDYNTAVNNTCTNNEAEELVFDELAHKEYVAKQFVWFLAGCGMVLVTSIVALVQFRRMEV